MNDHFGSEGFSGCFVCGSKQHRAANCKVGSSCAACGQREHNSKSCALLDKWVTSQCRGLGDTQIGLLRTRLRTENPICFCCFGPHKVTACRAKEASAFFRRVRGRERNALRKWWIDGDSGSSMPYCSVVTARKEASATSTDYQSFRCDGLEVVVDELVLKDEIMNLRNFCKKSRRIGSDESDSSSIQILDHDNVGKDKGVFVVKRNKCRGDGMLDTKEGQSEPRK
uniref:CCHC-type domain-containing protein n=1 Tax=Globodera rostochiensis TaxID=31243 RepID=A0A914HJ52_GLORO